MFSSFSFVSWKNHQKLTIEIDCLYENHSISFFVPGNLGAFRVWEKVFYLNSSTFFTQKREKHCDIANLRIPGDLWSYISSWLLFLPGELEVPALRGVLQHVKPVYSPSDAGETSGETSQVPRASIQVTHRISKFVCKTLQSKRNFVGFIEVTIRSTPDTFLLLIMFCYVRNMCKRFVSCTLLILLSPQKPGVKHFASILPILTFSWSVPITDLSLDIGG